MLERLLFVKVASAQKMESTKYNLNESVMATELTDCCFVFNPRIKHFRFNI